MLQTLEFVLGMILFYLIASPRFRHFLKRSIQSWRPQSKGLKVESGLPTMPEITTPVRYKGAETRGGALMVNENTLAEWQGNIKRNGG